MCADPSHQPTRRPPLSSVGVALWLVAALAFPVGRALAGKPSVTLVQPSSSGAAKTARQALLKQRATAIGVHKAQPGKIVGGGTTPPPRTIVTKRFLPK